MSFAESAKSSLVLIACISMYHIISNCAAPTQSQTNEFRGKISDGYLKLQARTVSGKETRRHQFPFQVAIEEKGWGIVCSGSLVTKSKLVTAAHCLFADPRDSRPVPLSRIILRAGEHSISKNDRTEQLRTVERSVIHPEYDRKKGLNDIAILEVHEPFNLDIHVKTVELANSQNKYNETCSVSGWGWMYPRVYGVKDPIKNGNSDVLRVVELDIIDMGTCVRLHKSLKLLYAQAAHSSSICAGDLAGGRDSCQGDSGGPLVCKKSQAQQYLLVGIVSSGVGCAQKNSPGIYTDVANMEKWIKKNL